MVKFSALMRKTSHPIYYSTNQSQELLEASGVTSAFQVASTGRDDHTSEHTPVQQKLTLYFPNKNATFSSKAKHNLYAIYLS